MTGRSVALALLVFAALPAAARADTAPTVLGGRMPSLDQGRGGGTTRFAPAPMPNPDARPPVAQRDPNAVQLTPGLTRTPTGQALAGDGFASGSAYGGELERRGRSGGIGSTLAPSLKLRVPMQVEFR